METDNGQANSKVVTGEL